MCDMAREYVRKVGEVYLVGDSRFSMDSLVYLFREGVSAEGMVESYPALTLEQVHGALAFYLANQHEVDAYLAEGRRIAAAQHEESRRASPATGQDSSLRLRFSNGLNADRRLLSAFCRSPGRRPPPLARTLQRDRHCSQE
jgi:hypothetical protein